LALLLWACGCQAMRPSNVRTFAVDQARLPTAEFQGNQVTVRNVRNCQYRTREDYLVRYEDRTYDLGELSSVDFIISHFAPRQHGPAHTMLSFGFGGRDYVCVSVEARREEGEDSLYLMRSLTGRYDLMYVIADERDLIGLRTNIRREQVYMYPIKTTPEQAQSLFVDCLQRANQLAQTPEKYNLVTNNCTTNLIAHVDRATGMKIPYTYQVLLPGYSDQLAYELKLIDSDKPFDQTRRRAWLNPRADVHRNKPEFSQLIRRDVIRR
jgi:hypothetical protein